MTTATSQPVEAEAFGHVLCDLDPVAGGQQDARDAFAPQPLQHPGRALAQRVGHDEMARQPAVHRQGHQHRAGGKRRVAAAILAGVIAQILITPPGALATVPDLVRYGAAAVGFAVYLVVRRSVFAGVVAGEIVILAGKWWLG